MNTYLKLAVGYLVIFVVGAIAMTAFCVPIMRVRLIGREIDTANMLIHANKPREAMTRLERIQPWSEAYPALEKSRICSQIRAKARLGKIQESELLARKLLNGDAAYLRFGTESFGSLLQKPINTLINTIMIESSGSSARNLVGYETLAEELAVRGDMTNLQEVAKILLAEDPSNQTGLRISVQMERTPKKTNQNIVAVDQPQQITSPTPVPHVDHLSQARKHLIAREWDLALQECEKAAKADPDDPRIDQIRKLARAQGRKWGIVTAHSSRVFDQNGKQVGTLAAGSIVAVEGMKSSSIGTMLVVRPQGYPDNSEPVLLSAKHADVRSGLFSDADDKEVELRVKRAKILADLDALRAQYVREQNKLNPHAADYEAAASAYKAFVDKAKALTARRDAATGEERMKLIDELRRMKGEETQLIKAVENAKKKMQEWQVSNDSAQPAVSNSRIAELEASLAEIQKELDNLEYHP